LTGRVEEFPLFEQVPVHLTQNPKTRTAIS
jgi:hypothetical protein